jgi:AbrB family looped-hinge helix DNA binding protein
MAMKVALDKLGRIVLPKPLRERYGLRAGTDLEVTERAGEFVLRPTPDGPSLVNENGIWVHQGVPQRAIDILKEIEKDRDEQIRQSGGL